MSIDTPRPAHSLPASPISADEVSATRQPVDRAQLLPPRVFHDPQVFDYEQEAWFARSWLCIGREEDVLEPATYLHADIAGESVIVVRARDGVLRAFNNVCRHRGATILDPPEGISGKCVRLQCPYHAWIYELDGTLRRAPHTDEIHDFESANYGLRQVRMETWQGYVLVNLDDSAPALAEHLADLPSHIERYPIGSLRRARRIEYDVKANWKVIAENYSECYHCPGVHPQLNKLSPYDQGQNLESNGPWAGGWMELIEEADTMSTDGASHGRPPLSGINPEDERRIYYFVVWPNLLISLHPDYVMTHQVWPVSPERSRVICEWFFEPSTMALPNFDPGDAVDFWDLTNRQDWGVCERQQAGTGSRTYTPGRYSLMEDMVHAFDLMVADRYANDGVTTRFAPRHDKWSEKRRGRASASGGNGARTAASG